MATATIRRPLGSGPVMIMPLTMPPDATGAGSFSITLSTLSPFTGWGQYTANSGDNHSYNAYFSGGTYTLLARFIKGSNRGILKIQIDGVTVNGDGYDQYGSTDYLGSGTTSSIAISEGEHTIKILCESKNASASGYTTLLTMLSFEEAA